VLTVDYLPRLSLGYSVIFGGLNLFCFAF